MKKKKKWFVTLPIAGHIKYEVEAVDEKSAIDAAFEANPEDG